MIRSVETRLKSLSKEINKLFQETMGIKEDLEDVDVYPGDCYIAIVYFEANYGTQLWLDLQEAGESQKSEWFAVSDISDVINAKSLVQCLSELEKNVQEYKITLQKMKIRLKEKPKVPKYIKNEFGTYKLME